MKIKNICIYNMYPAILGIRNSYKNKDKSDSETLHYKISEKYNGEEFEWVSYNHCIIGPEDEKLIKKLLKSSAERKFLRQILVSMDIKGSIKFWAQMDTFKIATVRNSESTMHCITKGEINQDDFEQLKHLNFLIKEYNILKNKKLEDWSTLNKDCKVCVVKEIFELIDANLPAGYLLESHWTANYEVLRNIYNTRKNHKMYWWQEFCMYIQNLPYFDLIIK
jgi:hypothetical protein